MSTRSIIWGRIKDQEVKRILSTGVTDKEVISLLTQFRRCINTLQNHNTKYAEGWDENVGSHTAYIRAEEILEILTDKHQDQWRLYAKGEGLSEDHLLYIGDWLA